MTLNFSHTFINTFLSLLCPAMSFSHSLLRVPMVSKFSKFLIQLLMGFLIVSILIPLLILL